MGKTKTKIIEPEGTKDIADLEEKKAEKKKIKSEKPLKGKVVKFVNTGRFYIKAGQNNTLISFTDNSGNVFLQSSSGAAGFKNTKKGTPYAGAKAMEMLLSKLSGFDIKEARVFVRGIGPGREPSIRVLFNSNINIVLMEDRTPIPFGGPKPKKARRV